MPKESEPSLANGLVALGFGGGVLLFSITWALSPFFGFLGWVTGGIAFVLLGIGLDQILLAVPEQSRKRRN